MEKVRSIKDKKGNKVAMIVPVETWEKLLYEVELAEDEMDAFKAMQEKNPVCYPWEEVKKELFG